MKYGGNGNGEAALAFVGEPCTGSPARLRTRKAAKTSLTKMYQKMALSWTANAISTVNSSLLAYVRAIVPV